MNPKECEKLLAEISNQKIDCVSDLATCKREFFRLRIKHEVSLRFNHALLEVLMNAVSKGKVPDKDFLKKEALRLALDQVALEKGGLLKEFEGFLPRWASLETPADLFDLTILELREQLKRGGSPLA